MSDHSRHFLTYRIRQSISRRQQEGSSSATCSLDKNKCKYLKHIPYVLLLITLSSIFLSGCGTSMIVMPEIKQTDNLANFSIGGRILYDPNNNKDYLPRTLINDISPEIPITFRYGYKIAYGKRDVPAVIAVYNPLTILGFPIGDSTMAVVGKLDILKGEEIIKSYTATCTFEKTRSLFSEGETLSELRKQGLIAVRDNIEAQMCQDSAFLLEVKSDK
jgi:hypothetical protein